MRVGRGNRSTKRELDSMSLGPPGITRDLGSNTGQCDANSAANSLNWMNQNSSFASYRFLSWSRDVLLWKAKVYSVCTQGTVTGYFQVQTNRKINFNIIPIYKHRPSKHFLWLSLAISPSDPNIIKPCSQIPSILSSVTIPFCSHTKQEAKL